MPWVTELPSKRFRVVWRNAAGVRVSAGRSFPTKTSATEFGRDREAEVRRGEHRDPKAGRMLLREFAESWISSYVAEPRTIQKVRSHLDLYILKPVGQDARALGDLRLEDLDEMTVQAWVARLRKLGRAPSTISAYHRTLTTILHAAVRARKIRENPAAEVSLPKIAPASDFFWTREEAAAIEKVLTRSLDIAVFSVLLGTGIRWGELAGLHLPRWQPLRRTLSVVEVLEEPVGPLRLKAYPKGGRRRDLPVDPVVVEKVAAYLADTPPIDCGLDHGKRTTCPGLLFHEDGRPLSRHAWPRDVLTSAVGKAKARAGRAHDLRHTYASWLVLDGVPVRVVQELLGHASSRTTERYAHLAPSVFTDPRLAASLSGKTAADRESQRESAGKG